MEARKSIRNGNNSGMARKVAPPANPTGLYYAREHRGWNQDQLAAASGASKPMISKLESGSRELTRAWAEKFAGPLRVSAIRIVFWDKVGPLAADEAESEFAIPNTFGTELPEQTIDRSARKSATTAVPRQKALRSSVVKVYLSDWREFMGAKSETAAKALDVSLRDYEEIEKFPFRLTADEMGRVAKAIGVFPNQLFFPVKIDHLTEAQKKLPAGVQLLKRAKLSA